VDDGFRHYRGATPPRFAHESERQLARLLDEHGIPWDYEPRTFALEHHEDGRIKEAMTPDFYLPDADLWIEVTTMKPALQTRKNRKLRKLREKYGEIVTLVARNDFARLVERYGPGPDAGSVDGRSYRRGGAPRD
jgi:hypoxanthine phosphoribosyltransferase